MFLIFEARQRVPRPQDIENGIAAISVMVQSLVMTIGAGPAPPVRNKRNRVPWRSRRIPYTIPSACWMNARIIIRSFGGDSAGVDQSRPDPGVGRRALPNRNGLLRISLRALDMLMDRELDDEARVVIREIILSHSEVNAMHDLRTRSVGVHSFIQLHLELDGDLSLSEVHRIADEVEKMIAKKLLQR